MNETKNTDEKTNSADSSGRMQRLVRFVISPPVPRWLARMHAKTMARDCQRLADRFLRIGDIEKCNQVRQWQFQYESDAEEI